MTLLLAFASYYLAVSYTGQLIHELKTWQIVCQDELNRERCEQILQSQKEEEGSAICAFWKELKGQIVKNPELSRSQNVTIRMIRGSMYVLTGEFANLLEEDLEGCYLDEETANELFGSTDAVGRELTWETRTLIVRGVLQEREKLLLIRPTAEDTADRITLAAGEKTDDSLSPVPEFVVRYGISGDAYDNFFLAELLQLFLLLFPVMLGARFFRMLRTDLKGWENGSLQKNLGSLLWWILLLFVVYLLLVLIRIPADMIPDKWSNFQFWTDWWEVFTGNIQLYMGYEKTGREILRIQCFFKGITFSVLSVVLYEIRLFTW